MRPGLARKIELAKQKRKEEERKEKEAREKNRDYSARRW